MTKCESGQKSQACAPLGHGEVRRLLAQAQEGNEEARERLVTSNLRLVWHVVNRFRRAPVEEDELFQVGCVGLLKAIDQFDLSYDVKFSTYAVPVILGEIRRQLRDFSAVKVSRSKKQLAAAVKEARQRLVQLHGREPTMQELADELGVDTAEVAGALEATRVPLSLFEKVGTAREAPELIDTLAGSGEEWFESLALRQVLEQLEPRERQIILLRFFRDRTQAEVGAVVGLSQVQVSRIERRVLQTLRERLSS